MVFNDPRPRNLQETFPDFDQWEQKHGTWYGSGHYCNATQEPWSKHFNMFSYVTEDLPSVVERYFPVDPERRSVTGFSMGGNGALIVAAKRPERYRSVTSFAPLSWPSQCESPQIRPMIELLFGNPEISDFSMLPLLMPPKETAKDFSICDLIQQMGPELKFPPGFVDMGEIDEWEPYLQVYDLKRVLGENGHDMQVRYHDGYDHSWHFINDFIDEHINFHAMHLKK